MLAQSHPGPEITRLLLADEASDEHDREYAQRTRTPYKRTSISGLQAITPVACFRALRTARAAAVPFSIYVTRTLPSQRIRHIEREREHEPTQARSRVRRPARDLRRPAFNEYSDADINDHIARELEEEDELQFAGSCQTTLHQPGPY